MGPKKDGRGRGGRYNNNRKKIDVKQTPVAERQRIFSECSEDQCSVCWNDIKIFAVGHCNHHVCHVCSTRMRVLCSQNDCPICRQDLPKIILSSKVQNYEDLANEVMLMDRKYQTCFENENIKKEYEELLQHRCSINHDQPVIFRTFKQLDTHVRREHELFFCDLCTTHLKVFSHERKLYTRPQLAVHRRKGDPDDSSHRGHPLCEFCEVRFVDDDELFRHLRRDHFFCHFCDADGIQEYYPNYKSLRDHFQDKHYLCLEDNCVNEQFTHAFRSELDLKAHRLEKHSQSFSKSEARLNRQVGVDVTFNRPPNPNRNFRQSNFDDEPSRPEAKPEKVPDLAQDFPSLNGAMGGAGNNSGSEKPNSLAKKLAISSGRNVQTWATSTNANGPNLEEDFPSLPGATPLVSKPSKPPMSFQEKSSSNKKVNHISAKTPAKSSNQNDYPELPSSNSNIHAFGSTPLYRNPSGYQPAWSQQQQPKHEDKENGVQKSSPKCSKKKYVAPAPNLDFPALGASSGPPLPKVKQESKNHVSKDSSIGNNNVKTPAKSSNSASLASAADLIFSDKPKPKPSEHQQFSSKKNTLTEDLVENDRSIKGIRNEGYAQSNVNPSLNIVTTLPSREPPPGFNSRPSTATKGQQKSYKAKSNSKRNYISPPDFNDRNSKLMGTISTVFGGGKSLEFNNFKSCSNQFRSGQIKAPAYLEECSKLLESNDKFDDFMPEMIVLLPNIQKQTELLEAFRKKFSRSKVPSSLNSCNVCGQVLHQKDKRIHEEYHDLDEDFPAL